MKNFLSFLIGFFLLAVSPAAKGQSRKFISQFSHFQSYYNPALTGYEGSSIRGMVRNQWAGFDGAPMGYFLSAEIDFAELNGAGADAALTGKNALGINLFQDQYGPFNDTELILSYASRIRLSQTLNLRLGAGLTSNFVQLDGNRLSSEEAGDAVIGQYLNSFANMRVLDFNIGAALTHENFYVSYGMQHVNRGAIQSGDVFFERRATVSVVQAGFRQRLSEKVHLATNFMYRDQVDLPANVEFNVKTLFADRFWVGAGHRVDYAHNFHVGFIWENLRLGYVYEMPMTRSFLLPQPTHEFMVSLFLFGDKSRRAQKIW
ncbi:MAG: PorP/SprF family type IX secretion system membrane protein [Nitritalea sp.]